MKKVLVLVCAFLFVASVVFAAGKTYQVTGPVLEVTPNYIVVQKGKEKWEVARDASTKVTGDLKVGSKVTVEYTMKAVSVEAKEAKEAKKK